MNTTSAFLKWTFNLVNTISRTRDRYIENKVGFNSCASFAPPIVLDDTCFDFKLHVEYKIVSCRALKPYLTSIILEKHHKFLVRMSDLYILMYSYPL